MVWLPRVKKNNCLFVLTESTNVTDEQTDRQTDRHAKYRWGIKKFAIFDQEVARYVLQTIQNSAIYY